MSKIILRKVHTNTKTKERQQIWQDESSPRGKNGHEETSSLFATSRAKSKSLDKPAGIEAEMQWEKSPLLPEVFALLARAFDFLSTHAFLEFHCWSPNFSEDIFIMLRLDHSKRLPNKTFANKMNNPSDWWT